MLSLPASVEIFVATSPTDCRRSFDGLAALAREQIGLDPLDGGIFLFFNARADRVKLLLWDRTGFVLVYKRLERGTFRVPRGIDPQARSVEIDHRELALILEGIELPASRRRAKKNVAVMSFSD